MKKIREGSIPEGNVLRHPGGDLKQVMCDVFSEYPEESFYFLNEKELRKTAEIFQSEFLPNDPRRIIAYAVKANAHDEVLRILSEAGIKEFDCSSVGEIDKVCDVNPDSTILYNNPHKKVREIESASARCVRHYTADFKGEVDKILNNVYGLAPEIAIRLKTLNAAGAKINLSSKFGTTDAQAKKLLDYVKANGAYPGVSMNVGSQVTDLRSYEKNWKRLISIVSGSVGRVMTINFGGGMPVFPEKIKRGNDLILAQYLNELSDISNNTVDEVLMDSDRAGVIIEPGRSMISSAVDLAVSIVNVRGKDHGALTIDDGIFTSFSDSVIHNWKYLMHGIDSCGERVRGKRGEYTLYGRTCDSGDLIRGQVLSKKLRNGDYLHVPNAGAYFSSQATHFNGYPSHRYVVYNS